MTYHNYPRSRTSGSFLGCLLALLMLFPGQGMFAGGGWTLEKGAWRAEVGFTYLKSDQLFNGSGAFLQLVRPVTDLTLQANLEYGLFDNLTLIGNLPFKYVATTGAPIPSMDFADTLDAGSLARFGNARFGARWQVLKTQTGQVLALQLMAEANTSDVNQFTGLQTGFDAWSFEPVLAFGVPFDRSYLAGHAGMAIRSNRYSEEALFVLEAGYRVTKSMWLAGVADVRWNLRNGDQDACNCAQTGLYVNNQASVSYGLKGWAPVVGGFGITAGAYGAVYADRLAAAPTFNVGIYYQRQPKQAATPAP